MVVMHECGVMVAGCAGGGGDDGGDGAFLVVND